MKVKINIKLFTNDKLENTYESIPCLKKDGKYSFIIEEAKMEISSDFFLRETSSFKFYMHITKKEATLELKENNLVFDIEVEKVRFKEENGILLEYKINSDEEQKKIIIEEVIE